MKAKKLLNRMRRTLTPLDMQLILTMMSQPHHYTPRKIEQLGLLSRFIKNSVLTPLKASKRIVLIKPEPPKSLYTAERE